MDSNVDTVDTASAAGVVSRGAVAPSVPSGRADPAAVRASVSAVPADPASARAPGGHEGVADRGAGHGEAT